MAFLRFPPELWEAVLERVDDSQDVLNTFQAYPELEWEGVLKLRKQLWLFDRVLPQIFSWLLPKEVFLCRRVCKQWCHGVDNFLENHPHHRAYSHSHGGRQITGQVWIAPASPLHYPLGVGGLNGVDFYLKSSKLFREFSHDMGRGTSNPFVGRSVHIGYWHYDYYFTGLGPHPPPVAYWTGALELLREFGEHIWFLHISFIDIDVPVTLLFCELVMNCLRLVPNLKGLRIQVTPEVPIGYRGELESNAAKEYLTSGKRSPLNPQLCHLETLEIVNRDFPPSLSKFLIESYSPNIRRLGMSVPIWKAEYGKGFPNLTELILADICWSSEAATILRSLDSPNLWRLELKSSGPVNMTNESILLMDEILPILTSFTKLQSLTLCQPYSLGGENAVTNPLPSVKSLVVHHNLPQLDLNVLRWFPSLEHLKLANTSVRRIDHDQPNQVIYDGKVWGSLLPKLKTLLVEETGRSRLCTRANYQNSLAS